ncbi:MAG TPA: UbiA family prenyltransferase [Planctomycetota bacterium]|nr:UbiA family prenyltransferase [Planctomycetota bacterium]
MPRRWLVYLRESFSPLPHAAFAALWYVAAWASVQGHPRPGLGLALGIGHAFFMLLALRVVDDLKDLEHDRRHHPSRPLASGRVSVRDARALLVLAGALLAAIDGVLGPLFVAVAAADIGLAIVIALAKPRSWLVEVVAVQPLNMLITLHAYLAGLRDGGAAPRPEDLAVFVFFSAAILQLEVARKTAFEPRPGEELYSELAGPGGALVGAFALAASAACALAFRRAPTWWVVVGLLVYANLLVVARLTKVRAVLVAAGLAFLAASEVQLARPSAREAPLELSLAHRGDAR